MRYLSFGLIGLLFGLGIVVSGMGNPAKVLNFFDIAGSWDPSLALVMTGALGVTAFGYRYALTRPAPLCETRFHLPEAGPVDARLIGGAAIFGIGWGIAGFCPGGAIGVLGTGRVEVVLFAAAMLGGMLCVRCLGRLVPGWAGP